MLVTRVYQQDSKTNQRLKWFVLHLAMLFLSSFSASTQSCAVVFVGAEAGMREFNCGFHGEYMRPGTVSQPLASSVCVITASFSSRLCFCDVAS